MSEQSFATTDAVADPASPPVYGVLLAGGQARRMGGQDKGLVTLAGEPMIVHALRRLRPQVAGLIINANRNIEIYQKIEKNVVADPDDTGEFSGPLAGMLAALRHLRTRVPGGVDGWLLTAPCDSPLLAPDYAARMRRALQETPAAELAVASDGERLQPVFALLPAALSDDLARFLVAGERKIDRWYARHPMIEADFSDCPEMFLNINTPDDLRALERRL